jgi:hypothetical protein
MSDRENPLTRWARLKQAAKAVDEIDTPLANSEVTAVPEAPFDPLSLPSIEAIVADTDILAFLRAGVPAELTRAALRRAWASDPAIRDFIGIAENQWDFNDPTAMPGFGPMIEADDLPALLARALGGRDKLADMIPEISAPVENALPALADREHSNPDQSLQRAAEALSAADEIGNLPNDSKESTAPPNEWVAEEDDSSRNYRSHGSALPR